MKLKEVIILSVIFALLLAGQIINLTRLGNNLVSNDPYYHKALTDFTIENKEIIYKIPNSASDTSPTYFTLLYPLTATLSLILGMSTQALFLIMGTFLLFLVSLSIFIISKKLSDNKWIPYCALLFFLSINYLLTRTSMNLPENYALIFFAMILFFSLKKTSAEGIAIFLVAYAFYHPRSVIFPLIFLGFFLLFKLKYRGDFKTKRSSWKYYFLVVIIAAIVCLPIILEILKSYLFLVSEYFGDTPSWSTTSLNLSLYSRFGVKDFYFYLNTVFLLVISLGTLSFLKSRNKSPGKYAILLMSLLLILFPLSSFIGQNVPPYRFAMYLAIFSPFLLVYFLNLFSKNDKKVILIFILLILILFVQNVFAQHGWLGMSTNDEKTIQFLRENHTNSIIISYGAPYYVFFKNAEWDSLFPLNIFGSDNKPEILSLLNERYDQNKSILLVITQGGYKAITKSNPSFMVQMKDTEIFKTDDTRVYEIILPTKNETQT